MTHMASALREHSPPEREPTRGLEPLTFRLQGVVDSALCGRGQTRGYQRPQVAKSSVEKWIYVISAVLSIASTMALFDPSHGHGPFPSIAQDSENRSTALSRTPKPLIA